MLRVFLLGASLASIVGGNAAAHEPGAPYQSPPWSGEYAYQGSASRMWSSWTREAWDYRYGDRYDRRGYSDEWRDHRDYRDCRCGPEPRARHREVYLRPGPVYMDRRPVYIEQPPIYIEQPPIYVASPPIHVQGPPIYVESPPVYVDPPAVHLTPGPVHVAPPEVHVRPAEVIYEETAVPLPPPPPPPPHFGDLPPPGNIPPVAPPPAHNYRQEPGERG